MKTVYTVFCLAMVSCALSGCVGGGAAGKGALFEKTISVEEFDQNHDLRKQVLAECKNNPGELSGEVNCTNAAKSDAKALLKAKAPRF